MAFKQEGDRLINVVNRSIGIGITDPTADIHVNGTIRASNMFINGILNPFIPRGGIVMWNKPTIPTGWALCNGSNGTPDLRNRFVLSSGAIYTTNNQGGGSITTLTTIHLPSHTHSVAINQAGLHTHVITGNGAHTHAQQLGSISVNNMTNNFNSGLQNTIDTAYPISDSSQLLPATSGTYPLGDISQTHSHTMLPSGSHTHKVTIHPFGSVGASFNSLPAYYVLYYIMKL